MYKVFSNGRKISFTNQVIENLNKSNGFFYRYVDKEELNRIIDFFETVYSIKDLFLIHDDPETLFNDFLSLFDITKSVGGLITNDYDEVLLVKRWHKWDLPKAEFDESKDIAKNIIDSLNAECGLYNLRIEEILDSTYYMFNLNNERILKKVSWCKIHQTGPDINSSDENSDFKTKWVSIKDLHEYLPNAFDQVAEVINSSGILNS